jgi:hypothetical protein
MEFKRLLFISILHSDGVRGPTPSASPVQTITGGGDLSASRLHASSSSTNTGSQSTKITKQFTTVKNHKENRQETVKLSKAAKNNLEKAALSTSQAATSGKFMIVNNHNTINQATGIENHQSIGTQC